MVTSTLLERFVSGLNGNVFLREFAFSRAELLLPGVGSIELADHLVFLDDHSIAFQLKERDLAASPDEPDVRKWFDNKVRKRAVTQLQKTLQYLRDHAGVEVTNDRGHRVALPSPGREALSALVVFRPPDGDVIRLSKGYASRRAGFVHFIPDYDYFGVCQILATPTEIIDYLRFRESILLRFPEAADAVSEAALVCQFMLDENGEPDEDYASALHALKYDARDWDISFLTQRLGDQITYRKGDQSDTAHYCILAELGKLSRTELRALKERLTLCLEAVDADRFELPYRFAVPRTDCAFLLVPVTKAQHEDVERGLSNLALGSKYELRTSKQIGLAVMKSGEYRDLLWLFMDFPHESDPEIEAALASSYPFRPTRDRLTPRYEFDSDKLPPRARKTAPREPAGKDSS